MAARGFNLQQKNEIAFCEGRERKERSESKRSGGSRGRVGYHTFDLANDEKKCDIDHYFIFCVVWVAVANACCL